MARLGEVRLGTAGRGTTLRDSGARSGKWGLAAAFALFVSVCALVFWYLPAVGVSNTWIGDGTIQHIPALAFFRRTAVAWLQNPASAVPLWSWNLGLGADIPSTLMFYVADPFSLVSLLFPASHVQLAYEVTFFLRLACAWAAGYYYLRLMRATRFAAALGSVAYVFTTFTMFSALRHSHFVNPMVLMPLILAGVEFELRGKTPALLISTVAIAAAYNYYFAYQLMILCGIYTAVRCAEDGSKREGEAGPLRRFAQIAGHVVVGLLLSAVVLLPAAIGALSSSRSGSQTLGGVLASLRAYGTFVTGFVTAYVPEYSAFMGYTVLGLLLAPVAFMRRELPVALKVMLVVFPVLLLFPFLGSALNAFAFPSYRYLFAWGLFIALAIALVLSDPRALTRRELAISLGFLGAYSLAIVVVATLGRQYAVAAGQEGRAPGMVQLGTPLVVGIAMWVTLALESRRAARGDTVSAVNAPHDAAAEPRVSAHRWVLLGLVVLNIALVAAGRFHPALSDVLEEYVPPGTVVESYRDDPGSALASLQTEGFARADKQSHNYGNSARMLPTNDALIQEYNGLTFYYSVLNGRLYDFMEEVANRTTWLSFGYSGFDDRAALLSLAGVEYYMTSPRGETFVPYGFDLWGRRGGADVYRNRFALPLGFAYDSVMTREVYDRLTPLEKQQALLQAALVEEAPAGVPVVEPQTDVRELSTQIVAEDGARLDRSAGEITLREREGSVTLRSEATSSPGELYVDLDGIDFNRGVNAGANASWWQRVTATERPSDIFISVSADGQRKKFSRWMTPEAEYFVGDRRILTNLGYREGGPSEIRISVRQKGVLSFDALKAYSVPVARYERDVRRLAEAPLRDVEVGTNSVRGSIEVAKPSILFLSIPFSSGWRATVDGAPAPTMRVNTGFTGIALEPGRHDVSLRYTTPGIVIGAMLSALGAVLFVLILVRRKRANGHEPPVTPTRR